MRGSFNHNVPSLWLREEPELKQAHKSASFVEYLRWMRCPELEIDSEDRIQQKISQDNQKINNDTKAEILQKAVDKASNYRQYFERRNANTRLIAGEANTFEIRCAWRVRVGGTRGPEDMLLPAFDAMGMPYIPSTTLRGVARNQGVQELTREKIIGLQSIQAHITPQDWQKARREAEIEIEAYFGSLDAPEENRTGKVIFLDAYPLANTWGGDEKGLAVDIANNIWKWEQELPTYQPNPNLFLSLRKPSFLVALLSMKHCDEAIFEKVKGWLVQGLQAGIGSQVNSGYGEMIVGKDRGSSQPFLQVNFTLTGQLIHSCQKLTWNDLDNKYEGKPEAEVRAVAFKSMLRYWFRSLALGVLPVEKVYKCLEPRLFGSLQPQTQGWLKCRVEETSNPKPRNNTPRLTGDCLSQAGQLKLYFSAEVPEAEQDTIRQLFENLTWLMFHLGGVGQGARRPLYSRQNRPDPKPPYYRGTRLRATSIIPDVENGWELPDLTDFQGRFRVRLRGFYGALARLNLENIDPRSPYPVNPRFREVVGQHCTIVVCSGKSNSEKPFALDILHRLAFRGKDKYDSELCGDHKGNPSPIWVVDLEEYQVVTIFDIQNGKRREFLNNLRQSATKYEVLWDSNGLELNQS